MNAKDMLAKARANLVLDQPFFASLLLPMPITEDNSIPTLATDGESIIYNAKFIESLNLRETIFAMAHEVLHCVFDHMGRRESRNPNTWNQAADYVINGILHDEKIGSLIKGVLHDPGLVKRGNGTAEGVYKLLPASSEKNKPGKPGGSLDSVLDAGSDMGKKKPDQATKRQKSADMKVRVIQARNAAKMQGNLSAGLDRLVKELTKPVVDWKEVLRRFVSERTKNEFTFARPKRRYAGEDFILPSLSGEKMGEVVVAVDCSGSIQPRLLDKFASEINGIKQDMHPSKISVLYFDTRVLKQQDFEAEDEITLKPIGGGGTMFSPVFEEINKRLEPPVAVVFLTDLYCNDFGPTPDYPVLWCVLEGGKAPVAPFGEIVEVSKDEN